MSQVGDFGFGQSRPVRQTPSNQVDIEFVSMSDTLSSSITNLEKRLDTCGRVYALAGEANDIRERERTSNNEKLRESLQQLDDRITTVEDAVANIPKVIKQMVADEFKSRQFEKQFEEMLQSFVDDFEQQLDEVDHAITTRFQSQAKSLKSIKREFNIIKTAPREAAPVAELETALRDVAMKQTTLNEMMAHLRAPKPSW